MHWPPLSALLAKKSLFQISFTTVLLFAKPTYKIQVQICISSNQLHQHIFLLDTGGDFNIAIRTTLREEWSARIRYLSVKNYKVQYTNLYDFLGTIVFSVRIGKLHNTVWLRMVHNMSVKVLLGTLFIDQCMRRIFPGKRRVVHWHPDRYSSSYESLPKDNNHCRTSNHWSMFLHRAWLYGLQIS